MRQISFPLQSFRSKKSCVVRGKSAPGDFSVRKYRARPPRGKGADVPEGGHEGGGRPGDRPVRRRTMPSWRRRKGKTERSHLGRLRLKPLGIYAFV